MTFHEAEGTTGKARIAVTVAGDERATPSRLDADSISGNCQLTKTGVAVEKGTKAVISVNFSVYGKRTFNNLRTNLVEIP